MQPRYAGLALAAFTVCFAACSNASPPAPPLTGSSAVTRPSLASAVTPTPSVYVYAVNYASNDVAQYGFIPSTHAMVKLAPNFALPAGCNPVQMALVPAIYSAFVSCYGGSILPLRLTKRRTLEASGVAPVAVASPLAIVAPGTGTPNRLYAALYNSGTPSKPSGGIAELFYSKTSLKLLKIYPAAYYPGEMAFHTSSAGVSQLFVAAPYDRGSCASSTPGGTIEVWTQGAGGTLTGQPSTPICRFFWNVVVAGNDVFAAGYNFLKGFALPARSPMTVPAPPWAKTGKGPTNNPQPYLGTMSLVMNQPNPTAALEGHTTAQINFATANSDATVSIFDDTGRLQATVPIGNGEVFAGLTSVGFKPPLKIGKGTYDKISFIVSKDNLVVNGANEITKSTVSLAKIPIGNEPQSVQAAADAEFGPYH